jgi:hypothetical protein
VLNNGFQLLHQGCIAFFHCKQNSIQRGFDCSAWLAFLVLHPALPIRCPKIRRFQFSTELVVVELALGCRCSAHGFNSF